MSEEKKTGFMAFVGKARDIGALLIIVFTIIMWFRNSNPDLVAKVDVGEIYLPPDTREIMNLLKEKTSLQNYEAVLKEKMPKNTKDKMDEDDIYGIARTLGDSIREDLDGTVGLYSITDIVKWTKIHITNSGSKSAIGVEVYVPGKRYHEVNIDEVRSFVKKQGSITIDEIKPNKTVEIVCWSGHVGLDNYEKDITVVYGDGVAKIITNKVISDDTIGYWINENKVSIIFLSFMGIALLCLSLPFLNVVFSGENKVPNEKEGEGVADDSREMSEVVRPEK